jgi:hypothetical protein
LSCTTGRTTDSEVQAPTAESEAVCRIPSDLRIVDHDPRLGLMRRG